MGLVGRPDYLFLPLPEAFLPFLSSMRCRRPWEEPAEEGLGHGVSPYLSVWGVPHAGDEILCHSEGRLPLLLVSFSPWIIKEIFKKSKDLL